MSHFEPSGKSLLVANLTAEYFFAAFGATSLLTTPIFFTYGSNIGLLAKGSPFL